MALTLSANRTDLYFTHISSLSLFHRPTFERRVYVELTPEQASALMASMFCLAARYVEGNQASSNCTIFDSKVDPARFYHVALDAAHRLLRNRGDGPPPLFLLQTLILTTYHELIRSVQGVAWRSLGTLIRLAYEVGLHLVDSPSRSANGDADSVDVWIAKEEKRRVWWTIWELEVFATTIRRCPMGMNQTQQATLLPVPDMYWFEGKKVSSCFLEPDPTLRWKALQNSGNENGRTWFIVINSLMRDAHYLSNPSVPQVRDQGRGGNEGKTASAQIASQLAILDNCVSCFGMALPHQLQYKPGPSSHSPLGSTTRKRECDKQVIHAMLQLAKLMILRNDPPPTSDESSSDSRTNGVWPKYLHAAEQVVSIARDASPNHVSDGDPLLPNIFWMVAAIQIVQATFAGAESDKLVAQSNLDLLRLILIRHRDFWNTSSILVENLHKLENTMGSIQGRVTAKNHCTPPSPVESITDDSEFIPACNPNPPNADLDREESTISGAQPNMILDSGVFSLDSGDDYCTTSIGEPAADIALGMSMEAIMSGIWEHGNQNDLFFDIDILGGFNDL